MWADSGGDPLIGGDATDGQFDSPLGGGAGNELGFAGVTVQLLDCGPDAVCGDGDDGGVLATTTTDADGFTPSPGSPTATTAPSCSTGDSARLDLHPDRRPRRVAPLAATCDDQTTAASYSTLDATGSTIDYTNVDFGYDIPAVVFGTLWEDADGDGVQDPGEGPWSGSPSSCATGSASLAAPAPRCVTDANGDYRFVDLVAGNYTVAVDTTRSAGPAPGARPSTPTSRAPAAPATSVKASFTVLAGNVYGTYDFAYQRGRHLDDRRHPLRRLGRRRVAGRGRRGDRERHRLLYEDADGDGVRDCGPDGICGTADDVDALRA